MKIAEDRKMISKNLFNYYFLRAYNTYLLLFTTKVGNLSVSTPFWIYLYLKYPHLNHLNRFDY